MSKTVVTYVQQLFPILFLLLLGEGQTLQVTKADLIITVKSVRDFTSEGCLRGPIGCTDNVELEITHKTLTQQVTLSVAQTEAQREQRVNRTKAFDHEITLVTLKNKQVVLNIED